MFKKVLHILLVVIWLLVIFGFSNQAKENSERSSEVFERPFSVIAKTEDSKKVITTIVRKTAHFTEYFILSFLILLVFKDYNDITYKQLIIILIICLICSIFDEIHQSFIPGRAGRWYDVLIDTSASFIFLIGYKYINKIKH